MASPRPNHGSPNPESAKLTIATNDTAERAVLGAMLVAPECAAEVFSSPLTPDDFTNDVNSAIFLAARELYTRGSPVEPAALFEVAGKWGRGAFTSVHVAELAMGLPDVANVGFYIQRVLNASALRSLQNLGMRLAARCGASAADAESILIEAQEEILAVTQHRQANAPRALRDIVDGELQLAIDIADQKIAVSGIPTPFIQLDAKTGGFHESELTLVAARPGVGKTAMLVNIARHCGMAGKRVLFFSCEMRDTTLVDRLIAADAGLSSQVFRMSGFLRGDAKSRLILAGDHLKEANVWIVDAPGQTPTKIRAICRSIAAREGLDLVLIDYMQLLRLGRRVNSRAEEVSEVTKEVREIAKSLRVPIIAAAQVGRKVDERGKERPPILSDLKESGGLEEHSDNVLFLFCPRQAPGSMSMTIAKQRNGPAGTVWLDFDAPLCRFTEVLGPPARQATPP